MTDKIIYSKRGFLCASCFQGNNKGEKVDAICGYKYLCINCLNRFYNNEWIKSDVTARDNALERKDNKATHRYSFLMKIENVNEEDLKKLLVGYEVEVNNGLKVAILGEQFTTRQFAKLEKYGNVEIRVLDNESHLQTIVYDVASATDIQSYNGAYKHEWR